MQLVLIIVGWLLGIISSTIQSILSKDQLQKQTIMEVRLSTYSRLLSAVISEERYPPIASAGMVEQYDVDAFNSRMNEWRKNRKQIKAIATEVLLLTNSPQLKIKLKEFISNDNPDFRIQDIEELMKDEIGIK
jgi:hypothetical protein